MIVLDAAGLVELVADGLHKQWVRDELDGQPIAAPAHQLAEVVSAVGRLVRAGDVSPTDGLSAIQDATSLPQDLHPLDTRLVSRAWELRDRIRLLDGLYVALAERLDAPLVTTDRRLRGADAPCQLRTPAT